MNRNYGMGDRIRELRKQRSLSQAELAEKIGVSNNAVSSMEQGADIRASNAVRLSEALGTSLDYLITGKGLEPDDDFILKYKSLDEDGKRKLQTVMKLFF